MLIEVASVIKNSIREVDIVGRYGGKEFLVIFPGYTKEECFVMQIKFASMFQLWM